MAGTYCTGHKKTLNHRSKPAGSATAKQHELNTHKASWDQDDVGALIFMWEWGRGVELKLEMQEMTDAHRLMSKWACGGGVDVLGQGGVYV